MFLKFIKDFSVKRLLKNTLHNVKPTNLVAPIEKIGLLIDESYFLSKDLLINELCKFNIKKENINVLLYKDKIAKNESFLFPCFSLNEINWNGNISQNSVLDFINTPFQVLISYYDIEKAPLLLVTNQSKAQFKVGFSTIDKKLNHLMIATTAENYSVFTNEFFKYLKILNKL